MFPLPAILATAAALLISLSINLIGGRAGGERFAPDVSTTPSDGRNNSAMTLVSTNAPHFEYSETQSYLSGVGVIDRDVFYQIEE